MIIIYYRDATGKIVDAHTSREGQTMADIAPLVVKFNQESEGKTGRTATAAEVPDDGLEAYLYHHRNERMTTDKEALKEAIDALYTALEAVRYLED